MSAQLPARIGVIDVGSNSMRVAVIDIDHHGLTNVVEELGVTRRIIRDVTSTGGLREETMSATIALLADFMAITRATGAVHTIAAATSAIRDASNSREFVEQVQQELGLELVVLSGDEEARCTFLGAVHSLPVERGYVLDIGGGSLELAQFEDRELVETWTFPMGAVRLSDEFNFSDPPEPAEIEAGRQLVLTRLAEAGLPALVAGGHLVGTGGTIRNLSKVAAAADSYPLPRLHGHVIDANDLSEVRKLLCSYDESERGSVSGLNSDRADSIIAGVVTVQAVMETLGAESLTVSGQGLREGVALSAGYGPPPSLETIRSASIGCMQEAFAPRWGGLTAQRGALVAAMRAALLPELDTELASALEAATALYDIGRSIDYYRRSRHTESLLLSQGLHGYTHREVAATCAIVRQAGQEKFNITAYRPLLTADDRDAIAGASAILAAAEDICRRVPWDATGAWTVRVEDEQLMLHGPFPAASMPDIAGRRLRSVFGLDLLTQGTPAP